MVVRKGRGREGVCYFATYKARDSSSNSDRICRIDLNVKVTAVLRCVHKSSLSIVYANYTTEISVAFWCGIINATRIFKIADGVIVESKGTAQVMVKRFLIALKCVGVERAFVF